jgi:hypothetical protein
MRQLWLVVVVVVVVAGCTNSDLEPSAQGACSNISSGACVANSSCQLSFVEGGLAPTEPLYCLALEGDRPTPASCPQDHDGCRATHGCSPVFLQQTGPTDAAVGDPVYDHCALTAVLLTEN